MNLISLLQSLFKKRTRPHPNQHQSHSVPAHQKPVTSSFDVPKEPLVQSRQPKSPNAVPVIPQPKPCQITIHYLNEHQAPLKTAITLTGLENEPIHIPWLKFSGYYLANITNLQQTFSRQVTDIWLSYLPKMAAPVFVIHRNLDGGLLVKPQLLRGALNEHYQATPFEGGVNFVQHVSDNQTGRFQEKTQTVIFKYDPLNLQYAKADQVQYIQLLRSTAIYEKPTQEALLTTQLPKHSIWQLYGTATTTTGKIWYNLGGYWILPTKHQLLATNPNVKQPYRVPPHFNIDYQTLTATDVQLTGTLHGPTVTLWQAPYITPTRQALTKPQKVTLTQVVILDNHSRWYELSTHHWVLDNLVTVDEP